MVSVVTRAGRRTQARRNQISGFTEEVIIELDPGQAENLKKDIIGKETLRDPKQRY